MTERDPSELEEVEFGDYEAAPEAATPYGRNGSGRRLRALTDLGNSERMFDRHGQELRWVAKWQKWVVWDGTRWAMDGNVQFMAQETARSIYAEASRVPGSNEQAQELRKEISKWARASEQTRAVQGMIAQAKSRPGIYLSDGSSFDTHPWLFNCANGTLELRVERQLTDRPRLREHRPSDMLTMLSEVTYDPSARCPRWEQFVLEICCGHVELARYLRRLAGARLSGVAYDQHLGVLWGSGGNGKTVFCETIAHVLGEYAQTLPVETLLVRYGGSGIPNDIARMRGSRLVLASEPGEGRKLNEELVKQLTGGDTVTARFMRGEWFEFPQTWDLWLRTNHKPVVKGTDDGIWRRIDLVPFQARFPKEKQDRALKDKLLLESSGILNWLLVGNVEWQQAGLRPPEQIVAASGEYRNEQDKLGQVLDACCEEGGVLYCQDLVRLYREINGAPITQRAAVDKMKERGFQHEPRHYDSIQRKQRSAFVGIQLRNSHPKE